MLKGNYRANAKNSIWVTDFTYVEVYKGYVYVALVKNCIRGR